MAAGASKLRCSEREAEMTTSGNVCPWAVLIKEVTRPAHASAEFFFMKVCQMKCFRKNMNMLRYGITARPMLPSP
jgi:hypothetical protein